MKVFYVMVLVLVAGAVPSHGRTESVGTLFNKTQPDESMNNVTVSSSKLVTYSYMYLVMQWPKSFCNYLNLVNRQCYQQVPGRFTVHGLWPQLPRGGIDCRNNLLRREYLPFNNNQLPENLRSRLNYHWPDLTSVDNNHYFWGSEYNKHGSCTFHNQNHYFWLTLLLVDRLENLGLSQIGGGPSIISGEYYMFRDIESAVRGVTSSIPEFRCINVEDSIQLFEIRFCVGPGSNGVRLTDCNRNSNCGNGMVYLPQP